MSQINTVFGCGNFGEVTGMISTIQGNPQDYLDILKRNGIKYLDTARAYGTSEKVISQLKAEEQGFIIDTKIISFGPGYHTEDKLKESFKKSLEELGTKKVHILYLHAPDRGTPFEETLKAINDIYKEGSFEKVRNLLRFMLF